MEFVGSSGTSNNIPVPNMGLTPEMLSKNVPLEFLLQPIIPLLSPPISDEPSFNISVPGLGYVYDVVCKVLDGPIIQVLGTTIAISGVAYCAWKLSVKWNEGTFGTKCVDPDTTERLDDEVARIMSVMRPEENTVTSACSSLMCQSKDVTSNTSFFMERLSQDSLCLCAEGCGPIRHLHSRIDQVMLRMEDMITGLKALDVPKKDSSRSTQEDEDIENTALLEKSMEDVKNAKKQMESNHQLFPSNNKDGEIAKKAEDIQEGIRKLEAASEKLGKALECSQIPKMTYLNTDTSYIETHKGEDGHYSSPANLRFTNMTTFDKAKASLDTHKPFPLRNMKRNIYSLKANSKPYPIIDEHSSLCCNGIQEGNIRVPCVKDVDNCMAKDIAMIGQERKVPLEIKYGFVNVRDTKSGDTKHKECTSDANNLNDVNNLKRRETWPMVFDAKEINLPKQQIHPVAHAASFTHSDDSDFQSLEQFKASLSSAKCKRSHSQAKDLEDFSPIMTPRSQHLTSVNKGKAHNSPRTKQHNVLRSNHLSFKNKLSPGKPTVLKPLDRLPEEPEPESLSESNEGKLDFDAAHKEETQFDSSHVKELNSNTRKLPTGDQVVEIANEPIECSIEPSLDLQLRKQTLYALHKDEKDELSKKLHCQGISQVMSPYKAHLSPSCAVLECINHDQAVTTSVSNQPAGDIELTNDIEQTPSSPSTLNQTISFFTSPFKKIIKNKTNDFQVKYVVAKRPNPDPGKNAYCQQPE